MSITSDNRITQSTLKRWAYRKEGACMDAWVIIADSATGKIDFSSPGRVNVYIHEDEQDAFQLAFDAARLFLAEQSRFIPTEIDHD